MKKSELGHNTFHDWVIVNWWCKWGLVAWLLVAYAHRIYLFIIIMFPSRKRV